MLNYLAPTSNKYIQNNFSMEEKSPVAKINLRGDIENKEFVSKVGKILGMILPKESCSTSSKENISSFWLMPLASRQTRPICTDLWKGQKK